MLIIKRLTLKRINKSVLIHNKIRTFFIFAYYLYNLTNYYKFIIWYVNLKKNTIFIDSSLLIVYNVIESNLYISYYYKGL